jgi:hypothetical protein
LKGRFCRAFAVATLAVCSGASLAADGILLPPAPVGPGGEDSITTSDGVRCSQSINSNGGYLDLGVAGGNLNPNYYTTGYGATAPDQSAIGYARIIIPLGESPTRLDCNALYELEIQRLKAEIQLLQIGLE